MCTYVQVLPLRDSTLKMFVISCAEKYLAAITNDPLELSDYVM